MRKKPSGKRQVSDHSEGGNTPARRDRGPGWWGRIESRIPARRDKIRASGAGMLVFFACKFGGSVVL